ncbi:MAG TPA: hypothetical protein VJH87_10100 [Vicinamibacteria bacterium]|nr:hypothetical protein [Vicinamibacteria bacterium]
MMPNRLTLASLLLASLVSCELRSKPALITVYSPTLQVSFPLPQGWTADEAVEQAGFHMQTFTGRSVDVPERAGIRLQIMAGPMPDGSLDEVATRYRRELKLEGGEEEYALAGNKGKSFRFVSEDGEERSRLALVNVEGTLYGLFARGEAKTMDAYRQALDQAWAAYSLERSKYFEVYDAPGGDVLDVFIRHPKSWERTQTVTDPGKSLFVGFRSPPLAVERDGTTVHATLEVTVNQAPPSLTVEKFYAARTETLGDTYPLLEHESMEGLSAISTLYDVETQLAEYLERTVYAVRDGKSFIYKFNCRKGVYRAIEPWIDEIVKGFFEPVES